MARPIHYTARYPLPAHAVFATLTDAGYLRARLAEIGGTDAALLEHAADADAAKYAVRQGVGRRYLPGLIQTIMRGDLMIERVETWQRVGEGRYEGTVAARVTDAPGSVSGTLRLVDAGAGAQLSVDGTATVDLPLVGGRIESAVAEQLVRLMARETRFTEEYLGRRA